MKEKEINKKNKYQIVQKLIDNHKWIKDTFGKNFLKLGNFYSITKKFSNYYHDGIYRLDFNLLTGLNFYSVGLNLTEDKELGLSQWLLPTMIPVKSFWKSDISLFSDFNNYTNTVEIHILNKDQMFEDTRQYSWVFIVHILDAIKAQGIEVSDTLYPFESNKNYDSNKTMEFIKNNFSKL